jgi:hypothetical protein
MGTQLYLPAGWARQLESRLDPIERLAELERDRTQAKGDIREILDRLADKHGATVRDVRTAMLSIDDTLSDLRYDQERMLQHDRGPNAGLMPSSLAAAMHYNELLARRIVAEVARISVDGAQPVLLHEVARRLKIDEASAESAMYRAVAERWLVFEGSSLFRIRLTEAGRALTFSCAGAKGQQ